MGIFLGRTERRSWIPEPPVPPFPGADIGGLVTVNTKPDLAMTVPAVWACVGLLANTISSLPLQTYRRSPDFERQPQRIDDPSLVRSPAAGMTQSQWLHMVMVSLLLRGNVYGRISARDSYGRASQVDLLNPDLLHVVVGDDGRVEFRWRKDDRPIPPDDIWHLPGLTMPGQKIGMSPISYAAATIGIDIGARQFASDFYAGGGIPKAVLESDQRIDDTIARRVKEKIMNATRSREPIVLGAGLKYTQISVRPEESQFLATQQADATQISRYFWIPPEMIGAPSGDSMTYANVEQRQINFLQLGVQHWLKRIEDGVSGLLPGPQMVQFDVAKLLRTDAETRAKIHLQYLAGKVLAPSEIREEIGKPEMTEAQKEEAELVTLEVTANGGVRLPQGAAKDLSDPAAQSDPAPAPNDQPGG